LDSARQRTLDGVCPSGLHEHAIEISNGLTKTPTGRAQFGPLQPPLKAAWHAAQIEIIERAQSLRLSMKGSERVHAEHARLDCHPALWIADLIGIERSQGRSRVSFRAQRTHGRGQQPLLA
jgi:hypothetical protein